jgi:hypothetical protein
MLSLRKKIRALVSNRLARSRTRRRLPGHDSIDWLPPVLGPHDWSVGRMADRSARWFFEREWV